MLAVAILAMAANACGSKDSTTPTPSKGAIVTIREPEVSNSAGEQFVTVTASGQWTLSISYTGGGSGWASVTPSSGEGNSSSVILQYEENTESTSRSLVLTLISGSQSSQANLTQKGKSSGGSSGGTTTDPDKPYGESYTTRGWLELPETSGDDLYEFFTYDMTISGRTQRNYSMEYSYDDMVALWVAYPLCSSHLGSSGRSNSWATNPKIPASLQPNLSSAWKESSTYARGHQIPSADRTVSTDVNATTFYFTNMTPQNHTLNSGVWATLETQVRGYTSSSDTVYVVTGCVVKGSTQKAHDNASKAVTIPVGYYKALLRYRKSGYKKGTSSYQYISAGVYFNHASNAQAQYMTVEELGKKVGVNFFVNLPDVVGESQAKEILSQDPTSSDFGFWGFS